MSRVITLVLTLVLVGTGCSAVRGSLVETGVADPVTQPAAQQSTQVVESEAGDNADSEPFAFTAPELFSGSAVSGVELYDNAPMVVSFVSPTCPVCLREGPEIAHAADQYPDITYLIVHSGADTDSYRSFADSAGLYQENVVHVEDEFGVIGRRFNVISAPTVLLVDLDGQVGRSTGALELQGHEQAAEIVRQTATS